MFFDFFAYPFLMRALVGVVILSVLAAILGVFIVLRRMAFFGDAIAHSSLAGIALGLLFGIDPLVGALVFSVLVALGIVYVNRRKLLALDTTIGVFYAAAVALGILIIGKLPLRIDVLGFLFGDILAISNIDLWITAVLAAVVFGILVWATKPIVQIAFQEDLAKVTGTNVAAYEYLFMALLALTVGLGIKIAGVVLIAPLLIIPAAAAKNIARNFRSMAIGAVICSLFSGVVGLLVSYAFNTASGPTIVLAAGALFFLTFVFRHLFHP